MDLKKYLPGKEGDEASEYLWSLIIEPGWVQSGIWRIEGDNAQVMFAGTPVAWELEEDLVNAVDSALSHAISNFPEELKEPSKTVFGVVSSWVEEGEIKEDYIEKIKKICTELSLKPVGFVVLAEAIAHLLKTEEGSPVSAVILGVYKENIEISVFKLGNLSGSTKVARSVLLADDVAEGLSRFAQGENVPSRFIIYDGREAELDEARQSLHKVNWEDFQNLKLLHTPKVEAFDVKRKIDATSLAGASELADVTAIEPIEEEEGKEKTAEEKVGETSSIEESDISPNKFGFALGKDIAKQPKVEIPEMKEVLKVQDVGDQPENNLQNIEPVDVKPQRKLQLPEKSRLSGVRDKFGNFGSRFKGFLGFWNKFAKFGTTGRKPVVFGLSFLIILFISVVLLWWFYPKATVTIYVAPKLLSEKFDVTLNPLEDASDLEERVLVAYVHETSTAGEKTKSTSGTKTVGEKAKGEVTIYRSGSEISLSAGTAVTGPNNLKFTLDNDVTLASGSAGTPGKTNAGVTAEEIGAQYNLASGTTFSVGTYSASDIEAKNESSFSGGSSSEISAVSKEDQDSLLKELKEELEGQAKEELSSGVDSNMILIEDSLIATASSKNFSDKVGDEATNLKLDLVIDAQILTIEEESLISLAESVLNSKVPEGFVLRKEQLEIDFDFEEQSAGVYKFEVSVKANLLPSVDADEVAGKIAGKYPEIVKEFLPKEVPGFVRAEITLKPSFPGKLGTLPRVVKNIEIELAAER
jgi:hypothetical protein